MTFLDVFLKGQQYDLFIYFYLCNYHYTLIYFLFFLRILKTKPYSQSLLSFLSFRLHLLHCTCFISSIVSVASPPLASCPIVVGVSGSQPASVLSLKLDGHPFSLSQFAPSVVFQGHPPSPPSLSALSGAASSHIDTLFALYSGKLPHTQPFRYSVCDQRCHERFSMTQYFRDNIVTKRNYFVTVTKLNYFVTPIVTKASA